MSLTQDEQRKLAIECGAIARLWTDTVSFITPELAAYTAAVEAKERERCANAINLSRSDVLLMAGEMTSQEWRTVCAVLNALVAKIRSLKQ